MKVDEFQVLDAQKEQFASMLELFPRLADFPLPPRRTPEQIWQGDAELLRSWAEGGLPDAILKVAMDAEGCLVGIAFAQLRAEAISQEPGAHLEALLVAENAQGKGIGKALVRAVEQRVKELGARSLTLNVFTTNERARGLYQRLGFDEELIRCIKEL